MTQFQADATFSYYADEEGDVYATTRGVNRLIDENGNDTRFYALQNIELLGAIAAEVPTAKGIRSVELWCERDIKTIVRYYALKGKPKAIETLDTFIDVGIKVCLQDQAGFNKAHPSVKKHFNWLDLREDAIQVNSTIMAQGKNAAFDALNIQYFGMRCSDHKAARFLQEAHRYENLPDYVDVDELQQLIYLRKKFVRAYGSYQQRVNRAVSDTKVAFAR